MYGPSKGDMIVLAGLAVVGLVAIVSAIITGLVWLAFHLF